MMIQEYNNSIKKQRNAVFFTNFPFKMLLIKIQSGSQTMVKPYLMATPVLQSPRSYSHLFMTWENHHTFSYKNALLTKPTATF